MDLHEQRQREERYRGAAQARLDEPVLAAAVFPRERGLSARVSRLLARRRDSAEPDAFLIAVTPMCLHVFASDHAAVGDELATWQRAEVIVTVDAQRRATIQAATGETLVFCTGNDDIGGSVLRYMQDPAVVAA